MKINDTRVMTCVDGHLEHMTKGKNYNVRQSDDKLLFYTHMNDAGRKVTTAKWAFVSPGAYRAEQDVLCKGTKHDQGKLKPSLLFNDFPNAIKEVLKVLKFGAEKYSEGNWLKVDNGVERYRNAAHRHMLAQEEFDDESGLLHLAHEATSVLMMLELKLMEIKDAK